MSTSSSFIILRQDLKNKKYHDGDMIKVYENAGYNITDDSDTFNKKISPDKIIDYIYYDRLKYINHISKEIYDEIFCVNFNSSFSELIDEFNLSGWGPNNTLIIPISMAEAMLEAINYLLEEKYDRKFEDNILNNEYIRIFGETYTPYFNFYHKCKTEFDEDYRTQQAIFKRIKIVLDMFIEAASDDSWTETKHVLIYKV